MEDELLAGDFFAEIVLQGDLFRFWRGVFGGGGLDCAGFVDINLGGDHARAVCQLF